MTATWWTTLSMHVRREEGDLDASDDHLIRCDDWQG